MSDLNEEAGENGTWPLIRADDRVVLVLGAGATISEMVSNAPAAVAPPTDLDFLTKAQSCWPKQYQALEKIFEEVWDGGEAYPLKYQRMEQLFASTFLQVLQTSGRSKRGIAFRKLFDQLVLLLRDTLWSTTGKELPDEHLRILRLIRKAEPASLNLITFNFDLLADRALRHGALEGDWKWNHQDGYGFKPSNWGVPSESSEINLLKLHGSMNWYIPNPSSRRGTAYNAGAPIYIPRPSSSPGRAVWHNRQKILGHQKRKRVFPLLVPPVFEKASQISGTLGSIWIRAQEILDEATVVIVWGYSLPPSDYHAEMLFAQGARRSKSRLIVVNPDRDTLGRVTNVCGHMWNRWFFRSDHMIRVLEGDLQ